MARKYVIKSETPRRGLINYGEALNDEQRAVVMAGKGPLLVIAGAGSGKTRTVTYRVARLVEAGVAPARILLVTFTNRAAREMRERVQALVGPAAEAVWLGTFHALSVRILRRHGELIGAACLPQRQHFASTSSATGMSRKCAARLAPPRTMSAS